MQPWLHFMCSPGIQPNSQPQLNLFYIVSLALCLCACRMNPQPVVVDKVGPGMDYPVSLRCSEANTPLKGDKVRLTAVEVWFEQMFSGLHMLECGLAQQ